jgi:5-methylcytosine-specific restriction endonuclease McrA
MADESMDLPRTQREARALGQKFYFTGEPCIHGHLAPRWTCNTGCHECLRLRNLRYSRSPKGKADLARRNAEWVKNNREASNRIKAAHVARNPEPHRERSRKHAAAYYWQKKELLRVDPVIVARKRAARRKWAQENPAENTASKRKWRRGNPEKCVVYTTTRRSRERGALGTITAEEIEILLERQGYRCAAPHCRVDVLRSYHCDHDVPLSRGGSNLIENLQILCPTCNMQKGAMTMQEWLAARRMRDTS